MLHTTDSLRGVSQLQIQYNNGNIGARWQAVKLFADVVLDLNS